MRVLVDTSVWIDFFNDHDSPQAATLTALIAEEQDVATCGVVLAEFFQGLRDRRSARTLERTFRDLIYLAPREPETYFDAARLYRDLRGRGVTVRSTIDCLIACLAAENDCRLLAKDRDLTMILASGLSPAKAAPLVG